MNLFSRPRAKPVGNYDYDEDDYDYRFSKHGYDRHNNNNNSNRHHHNKEQKHYDSIEGGTLFTGLGQHRNQQQPPVIATTRSPLHSQQRQHRQSPARIMRKLNCGASKSDGGDEQLCHDNTKVELQALYSSRLPMTPASMESRTKAVNNWQKKKFLSPLIPKKQPQSDITRPVLITVRDGDYSYPDRDCTSGAQNVSSGSTGHDEAGIYSMKKDKRKARSKESQYRTTEDKFVVGELPKDHPSRVPSSPFRTFGRSVRNLKQSNSNVAFASDDAPSFSSSSSSSFTTNNDNSVDVINDISEHEISGERGTFDDKNEFLSMATSCSILPDTTNCNGPSVEQDGNVAERTAQDVARKERWRRGIELEKKSWEEKAEASQSQPGPAAARRVTAVAARYTCQGRLRADTDSHITGDGSQTTGHTPGTGGPDTNSGHYSRSSAGDSTATTDTEESDDYDRDAKVLPKKHRKGTKSHQLLFFDGVAEDLGIFAKLILADGSACVGTAAAITRESLGCKAV